MDHESTRRDGQHDQLSRDVKSIESTADLDKAADMMDRQAIRRLAVVDNGKLVGVLSHGNLVQPTNAEGPAKQATVGVTRGA
ncbi:MAG TPA: CBS domain-containing protein [Dehalococcoidia bacterium]|nr:CBS domain-containing protein [Dehalococcoidia bacterium]